MSIRRSIYGLPIMRTYRDHRTRVLATQHRDHHLGFVFAGAESFFDVDWEREERNFIESQIAITDVFVDVGANQGLYTCLAASRGKVVAAVEPEIGNLRFLLSNIEINRFQVETYSLALSDKVGVAKIFGDGDTASLVQGWASSKPSFAEAVPVNTFDNLFSNRWLDSSVFIKIDVEGLEFEVLSGAHNFLSRKLKAHWLIETFPTAYDRENTPNRNFLPLFELMAHYGYDCFHAETMQPVSIDCAKAWASGHKRETLGRSNYLFTTS